MSEKLVVGRQFPPITTNNIHDDRVTVPNGLWTHLQFRRFAGCPFVTFTCIHLFNAIPTL